MVCCEAVESIAYYLRRGKQRFPALASTARRPDSKGVQVVKDLDDEFDRQPVQRVKSVGYGSPHKLQAAFVLADGVNQTDKTAWESALFVMPGKPYWYILRCIALGQRQVEVGLN